MVSFYIDSCIYLNIWKKEVGFKGEILWEDSKKLLEILRDKKIKVIYSGFMLKELMFLLDSELYLSKVSLFESQENFKKCFLSKEELTKAKSLANQNTLIGLYDAIHIILAKKTNSVLVSRDKGLLSIAEKENVNTLTPKQAINYLSHLN